MEPIHSRFTALLETQGFEGEVANTPEDLIRHATDESIFYVQPELVLYPRTSEDVALAVKAAQTVHAPNLSLHLTPRAAGTGLSGGSLNDSVVVNMAEHFTEIKGYRREGNDVIFDVEAGVPYRVLEEEMDKLGVYIPSFPASKDICTVGGMIGNNAAGADSFQHGHTAHYVESMTVVLSDAGVYEVKPLAWSEFEQELKRDDRLGEMYRHLWELLLHQEEQILEARPKTAKNSAGYALWDVISTTVEEFMKNRGVFDLTQVLTGSQGTLGIITRFEIRAIPRQTKTQLLAIPVFDLETVGDIITSMVAHHPLSIELFDGPTYQAAMRNPEFFRDRIAPERYKKTLAYLPWIYRKRFGKQDPHFVLLITFPQDLKLDLEQELKHLREEYQASAWLVSDPLEEEMLWQVRRGSYSLSKFADPSKRPAAFLEDMTVKPEQLGPFFRAITELFKKYEVQAYVHGHGGNGHLHFYPLLDFTDPQTAKLIPRMAEDFFNVATELGGNICGEHNDGIIRTPYLHKMFDQKILEIFEKMERVCDPLDIFNPGKKVRPRFELNTYIRHTN